VALLIAYVALRILIVLNWLFGAGILTLLASTWVNEPWTRRGAGGMGTVPVSPISWMVQMFT
jgi:hypothetical protein